jgi:hypothetical protein
MDVMTNAHHKAVPNMSRAEKQLVNQTIKAEYDIVIGGILLHEPRWKCQIVFLAQTPLVSRSPRPRVFIDPLPLNCSRVSLQRHTRTP